MKVFIYLKPGGSPPRKFNNVAEVRIRDGMVEVIEDCQDKLKKIAGFNLEIFFCWMEDKTNDNEKQDAVLQEAATRMQPGIKGE